MNLNQKISAFTKLGEVLILLSDGKPNRYTDRYNEIVQQSFFQNGWFTPENTNNAIAAIGHSLAKNKIEKWLSAYPLIFDDEKQNRVGVIMAGNIPAVGFHDFICVLMSGNTFVGKCASDDKLLIPFIAELLVDIEPLFKNYIHFTQGKMNNVDAYIATGSNNSARYFQSYFQKFPHIIRKNRNSVAVLSGKENDVSLTMLGKDIFSFFGLGCRNVSKLFVPEGYNFDTFFKSIYNFRNVLENNKYVNNYEYNRTIYLMGGEKLLDNNFLLLKQEIALSSPVAVLFYEYYNSTENLLQRLRIDMPNIQCVVSNLTEINEMVDFGFTQSPQLWDYADNIDTLSFLAQLKSKAF